MTISNDKIFLICFLIYMVITIGSLVYDFSADNITKSYIYRIIIYFSPEKQDIKPKPVFINESSIHRSKSILIPVNEDIELQIC